MGKILSIALSWSETHEKILNQGYVWIKTENGFITKDDVQSTFGLYTIWYRILLVQKDYGKTFALTKEELK